MTWRWYCCICRHRIATLSSLEDMLLKKKWAGTTSQYTGLPHNAHPGTAGGPRAQAAAEPNAETHRMLCFCGKVRSSKLLSTPCFISSW
jgi:hypothetical protein